MAHSSGTDRITQVSRGINTPPEVIYQAFLDPDALATWLPPDGMRGQIHTFDPRAGGQFRLSLTYLDEKNRPRGKSSEDTDTVGGQFVELVPNRKLVWVTEFESDDPDFSGEMRITWSLEKTNTGTEVTVLCAGIPKGIRLEDNETGSRASLRKLAAYVESNDSDPVQP